MPADTIPGPLPLSGRTVLVTGTIDGLTRDQAKDAVTRLGGTPAAGVSGKVDLIVLGEGAGVSKTAKARMLGIAVLDGPTFGALAADPTGWDGSRLGTSFADHDAAHPDPDATTERLVVDPAHWVAKGTAYPLVDGHVVRQVRFCCACGHHWMRDEPAGDDTCPRPANPAPAPWDSPAATPVTPK